MPCLCRRPAVWLPLWLAAVGLLMAVIDRPWADLAHGLPGALHHGAVAITHLADPLGPLALIGCAGFGIAALRGWRPAPECWNTGWLRMVLACCLAVLLALAVKEQLKYGFGRTWPETWTNNNPSWIKDGVFAFFPFHGGAGWNSFPSGHATVTMAPAFALFSLRRRWGALALLLPLLVSAGLLAANYHWPSDVLAGLGVGLLCGWGAVGLTRR